MKAFQYLSKELVTMRKYVVLRSCFLALQPLASLAIQEALISTSQGCKLRLNVIKLVKQLAWCLAHSKRSINGSCCCGMCWHYF